MMLMTMMMTMTVMAMMMTMMMMMMMMVVVVWMMIFKQGAFWKCSSVDSGNKFDGSSTINNNYAVTWQILKKLTLGG